MKSTHDFDSQQSLAEALDALRDIDEQLKRFMGLVQGMATNNEFKPSEAMARGREILSHGMLASLHAADTIAELQVGRAPTADELVAERDADWDRDNPPASAVLARTTPIVGPPALRVLQGGAR